MASLVAFSIFFALWFLVRLLTANPLFPSTLFSNVPYAYISIWIVPILPVPTIFPATVSIPLSVSWLLAALTDYRHSSNIPRHSLLHRPDVFLYSISIFCFLAGRPSDFAAVYMVMAIMSTLLFLTQIHTYVTSSTSPNPLRQLLSQTFSLTSPPVLDRPVPPTPRNASALTMLSFEWMTSTVSKGRNVALEQQDIPLLASHLGSISAGSETFDPLWKLERSRRDSYGNPIRASLLKTLFRAFGLRLMLGGLLKIGNDICVFISPVVLRMIILHLQDQSAEDTKLRGLLLSCALLATYLCQSLIFNQYFNINSTVQVMLRGSLVQAVFAKSCRLSPQSRAKYTSGQIQNLMSTDTRTVSDVVLYIHMLWSSLEQMSIALMLLVQLLGWTPTLAGIMFIVASMPLQAYLVATIKALREIASSKTDERVKIVSEAIKGIKLVKLYAWELSFVRSILNARARELDYLRRMAIVQAWSSTIVTSLPTMLTVVVFVAYSATGQTLNAAIVFPAIALFNVIRPPLLFFPSTLINAARAAASLNRLETFLTADELIPVSQSEHAVDQDLLQEKNLDILVENAAFSWDSQAENFDPTLSAISLEIPRGSLVAIVGPTGGGKSSLLAGILGELPIVAGKVGVRDGRSISFCDQIPFIQNATVRENVMFGRPFHETLYRKAVQVSCLLPDLKILPAGDLTEIGGRGVNLSGGQRARVSLARAVYSRSDICILDDPLSAVDAHVGKALFNDCIVNQLRGSTRLLTTNQVHYAASPEVDIVIVVRNGTVSEMGRRSDLLSNPESEFSQLVEAAGEFGAGEVQEGSEVANGKEIGTDEPEPSDIEEEGIQIDQSKSIQPMLPKGEETANVKSSLLDKNEKNYGTIEAGRLTRVEGKSKGRVALKHYVTYFNAMGVVQWVLPIAVFAFLSQVGSLAVNIWLSIWSEESTLGRGEDRTVFNLIIFTILGCFSVIVVSGSAFSLAFGTVRASVLLHERLLLSVFGAPSSFFHRTPEGRLVNRFNSDMDKVDSTIGATLQSLLRLLLGLMFTLGLILWATPAFIFFMIPVAALCVYAQEFYRKSSVDLRRLEAVARSPLYSHFGETLDGVVTIRAYGDVPRATHVNSTYTDLLNTASYASSSANRWLSIRLEGLGTSLIFGVTAVAVLLPGRLSASMNGLVLSYTMQILGSMTWSVRQFTETESQLSAIERISEYSDPPFAQEEKGGLEAFLRNQNSSTSSLVGNDSTGLISRERAEQLSHTVQPRKSRWPKKGRIDFEKVVMKYRSDLDPALKGVSFNVAPGEHVGIVGRTGAGKSSAIQSLFRLYELDSGRILIDGKDISLLKLFDLRSSLGIIPQEPFCFSGTIRTNLDMFGEHEDNAIQNALHACGLQHTMREKVGLDFVISEGGSNLSVGQRQLLCLGRALLRDSQILILDEATSSVSNETDERFQETLRSEMNHCTILTVAHRLHTVMRYDRIIVMSQGEIGEIGKPSELLSRPSMLSDLVDETGPSTAAFLRQMASTSRDFPNDQTGRVSPDVKEPRYLKEDIGPVVHRQLSFGGSNREPLRSKVRSAFVELRNALDEADSSTWNDELAREGVDSSQWRRQLTEMVAKLSVYSDNLTGSIGAEMSAGGGSMDGQSTDMIAEFMQFSSPRSNRESDVHHDGDEAEVNHVRKGQKENGQVL